ncbi:T9SS type A sorting domain-containing protein [Aureispira anguillae]|nr:T9SS type A sorting domain-containing protein [Aureispira anguillae]
MKIHIFLALLCLWLLSTGSAVGQTDFTLKFKVWKNTANAANYLGEYHFNAGHPHNFGNSVPPSITSQLCPGDRLVLENRCIYKGNPHSFHGGSTTAGGNNRYGECTIGLTSSNHCSSTNNPNYILHLADISSISTYNSSLPTYQSWSNWNYGTQKTITLPRYNSTATNGNIYLAISAGFFANKVNNCGCGARYYFIGLNLKRGVDPIGDQSICSGDAVNLGLNPNYSYTNWSPNNPNGTPLNTTTDYTVNVTNTATGCSITDEFEIKVHSPTQELITTTVLCYTESLLLTSQNLPDLTSKIIVDGEVIYDVLAGINLLPLTISGSIQGAGVINIEYVYWVDDRYSAICTKTYQLLIDEQIITDLQSSYPICGGYFQPICINSSGSPQPNVMYQWSSGGNLLSTNSCFTPTAYGNYSLYAYTPAGCFITRSFNVYDPGVGIEAPEDITYCSLTETPPSVIGWDQNPFSLTTFYGISWSYQDLNGTVTTIPTSGGHYQIPYMGDGTYTASVVTGNGCSEVFTITVMDALQTFNSHPAAQFNTITLGGNQFACSPLASVPGSDIWEVLDAAGNLVPHIPYPSNNPYGIKYTSLTGAPYTVILKRYLFDECIIYTCSNKGMERIQERNQSIDITKELTVSTFPNPTNGLVNIQLSNASKPNTSIQVMNSLGQVILETEVQEQHNIELDLSKENSGVYMIQLTNGEDKLIEKIIKQ